MRYAIILGRGVEGCGVTRCAIETAESLKKGGEAEIFATVDKLWPRGKMANYKFTEFRAGETPKKSDAKKGIISSREVLRRVQEQFDVVLVFSVPSVKHPDNSPKGFFDLMTLITKPKIMLQFDHNIMSIRRNANMVELCESMDALMTHSLTNPYAMWLKDIHCSTPLHKMSLGFDFDRHRRLYWKDIDEQDAFTFRWIGRLASWKNPRLAIDLHNYYLRSYNFITILEGLEASIGYEDFITDRQKDGTRIDLDVINKFRARSEKGETMDFVHGAEVHGSAPYLYPPYNNPDAMERLSRSAFGSDLYQLKPEAYGNNIENCHAEVVAVGAVPVFHKHFGDHVIHRKYGDPVSKCPGSGTIFLDQTNMESSARLMRSLAHDEVMRDDWRHAAFEFWKEHADIGETTSEIHRLAVSLITQKSKGSQVTAEVTS